MFDSSFLLKEMNEKKASGDLDIVFKKYCGQPMTNLRKCLESFLEASHQCLKVGGKFYVNPVRVRIEILMTSLIIFYDVITNLKDNFKNVLKSNLFD